MARRGAARDRLLEAALGLFNEHGVSGTSLQMIADSLGISKASVYYQFQTKDDIVLAVLGPLFDELTRLVRIAETLSSSEAQFEAGVSGLVELAVRHRHVAAVFFGDPAAGALVGSQPEFAEALERLTALLTGPNPDPAKRVFIRMMMAAVCISAADRHLSDISDDEIHGTLLAGAKRLTANLPVDIGNVDRRASRA